MKKIIFFLLFPLVAHAQFDIRAGLSNTILNINYGKVSSGSYFYGGNGFGVPSPVLEGEWKIKKLSYFQGDSILSPKKSFTSTALEICVIYSNHTKAVQGFSADNDPMYSSLNIQLLQIPVIFKGSIHISVLDENLKISGGVGIVNSYILNSYLKESTTRYIRNGTSIIGKVDYADEASAAGKGRRFYNSFCLELSFGFKRLVISERAWFSGQDMYMNELAPSWGVPRSHSVYFNAYDTWTKVSYGGGAFSISWKLN